MTGMKDQYFGVEVEMTGITREQAAQALADYFGTIPQYKGGVYDAWVVKDTENKEWKLMSDGSIRAERKTLHGYEQTNNRQYKVEMVSPKLTYAELPKFQGVCGRSGMRGQRSTVPAACTSMWTRPTTTARA